MSTIEESAFAVTRIRKALVAAGLEIVTDHPSEDLPADVVMVRNTAGVGPGVILVTVEPMTFAEVRRRASAKRRPDVAVSPVVAEDAAVNDAGADAVEEEPAAKPAARRKGRHGRAGAED